MTNKCKGQDSSLDPPHSLAQPLLEKTTQIIHFSIPQNQ